MKRLIFLFLPLILLVSCGKPKIDTSSKKAMQSSLKEIENNLSKKGKKDFNAALMTIAMNNLDFSSALNDKMNPKDNSADFLTKIKNKVNGMTAEQIINKADSIKKDRKMKQRQQALKEIKELEKKKDSAQKAKKHLSKFEILNAKFYKSKGFLKRPVIELTVRNGTKHAISRAYFKATYASPDRHVPWTKDSFNYKISGGIEPGEKQTWKMTPMLGDWDNIEVKSDGILTVKTVRVNGPNGKSLYDAQGLSDFEKDRLKELKKEYNVQ
jgi:hypothetical protein